MKEAIRTRALELGFDDCRFTSAAPPPHAEQFQHWVDQGHHAQMAYLARNAPKRRDPQLVLPGARSLITLAVSYHHSPDTTAPQALTARYAHYLDYHNVLAEPLKALDSFVREKSGAECLWYVDTGPILERDLAMRAGLGFVGKHTNLISRHGGNWFLIAEILTTLELEPDLPERNHCGACTRCMTACPTEAIRAPFELDARRCISYLTIENKEAIPLEFRRAIGNRVYGCDDCLAACPWNRFAREGRLMRSHWRSNLANLDLLELLTLDDAGFKQRFADTPMLRAKRRGLLRNACVVLGNIGTPETLPHLAKAAGDPEPLIAEHARWAIEEITRRHPGTR